MEKKTETTIAYWGYIGIMEKKRKTTIVYWGYIGIMEKKRKTTVVYWGYIGIRLIGHTPSGWLSKLWSLFGYSKY